MLCGPKQGDHESVAQRLDLLAAVLRHAAADHLLVRSENPVSGRVAAVGAQVGRPLDIAEEDRHRTAGKLRHRPSPTANCRRPALTPVENAYRLRRSRRRRRARRVHERLPERSMDSATPHQRLGLASANEHVSHNAQRSTPVGHPRGAGRGDRAPSGIGPPLSSRGADRRSLSAGSGLWLHRRTGHRG
jgi:hypothetical protein